ncbi:hypothetical protein CsSME_00004728 [Camellia sinensis var. sinensis]
MGCGMSKYGLVDVGTCGFLSKRNFEELHMDGTASTKLLIKEDVEYDDIDFNHSCNSLSSPTNNANITVKETTTTTGGNNSSMNKFGEGEKETEVDQDEKGGNKNNKEEIKEEEEDERGRKISDFDGSLIGSPSFREYCTNVAKDDFKDDGNSDGEEKETKVKGSHCNASPKSNEDMQDMRNCYDSLLSAAAATANSAYEFSESLRDMGTCLLEKTALNDDEESGKVLSVLGNVQFDLQKLVDSYRSHVILTITTPSESLLNELRTVEELQAARDEYDEEATLCVFRLKSLKQGQCRSLLTQAARHHAAQLNFFRKGLKFLEAVEPHIRLVTEKQHIDYQLSGLDDGEDGENEGVETNDDGELSFDYRQNKQGLDAVSTSRNSMELDQVDIPCPQVSTVENAEVNLNKSMGEHNFNREHRVGSHSAPIFAEKKFDPAERAREMQPSARKFHSYVLPTPVDVKSSISRTNGSDLQLRPTSHIGSSQSLWHSSPLEPEKREKDFTDDNLSVPTISKAQLKLKESNSNNPSVQVPPTLPQGLSLPQCDAHYAYDTKKFKRQAFSGPLTNKPLSTKTSLSASGPITSSELPQLVSGLLSRVHTLHPSSSPKVSPSASPPIVSSPKISELHELPRPPGGLASKPASSSIEHSAPLVLRNQELSPTNKSQAGAFSSASPLPTPPPLTIPRSFSIPFSNKRGITVHVAKPLESSQHPVKAEEVVSPPLTPISLSNIKLLSTVSEVDSHSGQIKGSATKVADVDLALAVKNKAIDISPDLKGTSIFLVGINGAMKTSMGKLLADTLRYYYFDSDNLVEEAAGGGSAGKSFRERDKEGFSEWEIEVLKQLSSMGRLVVCAGNGAVQSTTNLALLRHGLSIWIDVPLDMIARDAIENGSQLSESEIFSFGSYSELVVLYEELKGGYATADTTVSLHKVASQLGYDVLDAVTKEDMALEVLIEIEKLVRVKQMMEEAARPF